MALTRDQIAMRVAQEFQDGDYVNLGIGIPTLAANYVPTDIQVMLQSENGLLGMGPNPTEAEVDADMINAGKETVTAITGSSIFSSAESFAMIRGGHVDFTVLGAFEVDVHGNIASWMIPNKLIKGMGGAMDLVSGTKKIIITMEHLARGNKKIFKKCNLPLTGERVVDLLITDMAVFSFKDGKMTLIEVAEDTTVDAIKEATDCDFEVAADLKTF